MKPDVQRPPRHVPIAGKTVKDSSNILCTFLVENPKVSSSASRV